MCFQCFLLFFRFSVCYSVRVDISDNGGVSGDEIEIAFTENRTNSIDLMSQVGVIDILLAVQNAQSSNFRKPPIW